MSDRRTDTRGRDDRRSRPRRSHRSERYCSRCDNSSIRSNNQNDPDYEDEDYDTYPEDHPTEFDEHDDRSDRERDWQGETYMGKGVPNPDFKWGSSDVEKRRLYGSMRRVRLSKVLGRSVLADTPNELVDGLDSGVKQRSSGVSLSNQRYNKRLKMWTMNATSGGPTYTVKVRAPDAEGKFFDLWESDVLVSCSCPYWRWNGPEYHGKKRDYLKEDPRGTATPPDIQDPQRTSFICKHVYKALKHLEGARKQKRKKRRKRKR